MTMRRGWVSAGLGPRRPVSGTYGFDPAEDLPSLPVDHPGGLHAWMTGLIPLNELAKGRYGLDTLGGPVRVAAHRAALPESFVAFVTDPALRDSVPTCTSCYWESDLPTAPSPVTEGATLVRFLNDQQGCLFWYLHLLPTGEHEVLCGGIAYDCEEADPQEAAEDLLLVADGFDEFIARFWIENLAWYEVVGQKRPEEELSPPVRDYVRQLGPIEELG
ncbi:hypothetical protein AB0H43_11100 [Hamadaea sp. NPDC050747]|uniref:hypothetical protein n=1 Tax=Hamadaea sp. NPDC050747 TaxID=3155789 RepID=UPI003401A95C